MSRRRGKYVLKHIVRSEDGVNKSKISLLDVTNITSTLTESDDLNFVTLPLGGSVMERVTFKKNVGGKIEVTKDQVQEVQQVNGAVTDLRVDGEVVRVKGSYSEVMDKLGREVQPGGLEEIGGILKRDRKLKKFFES